MSAPVGMKVNSNCTDGGSTSAKRIKINLNKYLDKEKKRKYLKSKTKLKEREIKDTGIINVISSQLKQRN